MLSELKILIVDDEEDIRDLVREYLEPAGAACIALSNAMEAIEELDKEKFDLVISDVRMKEGSGVYLLNEIIERDELKTMVQEILK